MQSHPRLAKHFPQTLYSKLPSAARVNGGKATARVQPVIRFQHIPSRWHLLLLLSPSSSNSRGSWLLTCTHFQLSCREASPAAQSTSSGEPGEGSWENAKPQTPAEGWHQMSVLGSTSSALGRSRGQLSVLGARGIPVDLLSWSKPRGQTFGASAVFWMDPSFLQ